MPISCSKKSLEDVLGDKDDQAATDDILQAGTSAGGAQAKAILAWNPSTGEFRHGQMDAGVGFGHWLMKLDGIDDNRDKEEPDPQGYGLIEYAYLLMANAIWHSPDAAFIRQPPSVHEF